MEKIAVMSGKGGVGKSIVTAALATIVSKNKKVGVLDADVTGPSIPLLFGVSSEGVAAHEGKMEPVVVNGVKLMSIGFLLPKRDSPIIWRGPLISKSIEQLTKDTVWDNLDVLFVDLPPGTSDASMTVLQSGVTGIIIVMTPQNIVISDVVRAIVMAKEMNIPVIGIVENMSFVECPHCNEKIEVFGSSKVDAIAEKYGIKSIARLPLDKRISRLADEGRIFELVTADAFAALGKLL